MVKLPSLHTPELYIQSSTSALFTHIYLQSSTDVSFIHTHWPLIFNTHQLYSHVFIYNLPQTSALFTRIYLQSSTHISALFTRIYLQSPTNISFIQTPSINLEVIIMHVSKPLGLFCLVSATQSLQT